MKNKIHTIEVENNETQSAEKIIEKIRENKIIYVKNKLYEEKDLLDSITENGPAIILNSSGSSGKPRQCFHHLNNLKLSATTSCLLYTSPSPRDGILSRMPSSA